MELSNNTLSSLPKNIKKPKYNRKKLSPGIIHIGVGNFRVNFSNNLANPSYAAIGTASTKSGSHNDTVAVSYEAYNTAATAAWLYYRTSNTTQTDPDRMHSVYFGD